MSNWQNTLNFKSFWDKEMPIEDKAGMVCNEIGRVFPDPGTTIEKIYEEFNSINSVEEFNLALEQLYDWADQEVPPYGKWPQNKMCWVETF